MFNRRTLGAVALGAVAFLAACDDDDDLTSPELGNIVEVATAAGQFNTLLTAATTAGLAGALSDENADLTVFAPTDAAFDALPAGTLDALLADPDALADILLFHVVGENLIAADVVSESFIGTLNGQSVAVSSAGGSPTVSGAAIIQTNIEASNGTIHVIDAVMLPETRNIVELAQATPSLSTLVTAVVTANLAGTLSDENGEFTVFAPTNDAFAALPAGTLDALLADPAALADILLYHTASGRTFSDEVVTLNSIPSVEGTAIPVAPSGDVVTIDGANLVVTDIQATNGVIHVIDAVILP